MDFFGNLALTAGTSFLTESDDPKKQAIGKGIKDLGTHILKNVTKNVATDVATKVTAESTLAGIG